MKTKFTMFRITRAGMLLVLLFLVAISCKKKEDDPAPIPTPPVPEQKDVFTDPTHKIMSDYELANHRSFQGYAMYNAMKSGIGPMDVFKAGFGIFSAIDNYCKEQELKEEFKRINTSLSNIQTQLGVLENDFSALAAQLNFDVTALMKEMIFLSTDQSTAPIITAYGNADESGFRWYSDQAIAHNTGSDADSIFMVTQIKPRMNIFIENYTLGGVYATTLQDAINILSGYMLPSSTSPGLMKILARNIVGMKSQEDPLSQYMILENYFMQIANYQFQALTVQLNCFVNDSLDYQSFSAWYAQIFTPQIQQFLQAVDFLAVNLYDYRNGNQFNGDLEYIYAGLSPDTIVGRMMTRSQFIANLLYDACGVKTPVMCGSIVVPYYYNAGTSTTPVVNYTLTVGGNNLLPRTDTLIKSAYPYTYWTMSTMEAFPDNQWKVYNYGKFGIDDSGWPSTAQTINITGTTWGNTNPIQGKVTPLWYNPRDPSQTSTVKTDSCVIQFAYFAASWKWGFMAPCYATPSQRSQNTLGTYNNVGSTSSECQCPNDQPSVPFVSQFHSSQCKWETGGMGSVSYGNNRLFEHIFVGSFSPYTGGQIYACEFMYLNVLPAGEVNGEGISLFVHYNYNHTCQTSLHHYFFKIGDGINLDNGCYQQLLVSNYNCNGSILNTTGNQSGEGIAIVSSIQPNTYSRLGFEMEMGIWETSGTNDFNCTTNLTAQYTFNGLYTDF